MALRIMVYTGLLYQDLIRTGQVSAAGPLPPWVRPRLESADIAQLDSWADDLLDAPSLEALFSDR